MSSADGRILTTHAGSLPRPPHITEQVRAIAFGKKAADPAVAEAQLRAAVDEVVAKQAQIGLDIVNDGEFGKVSFVAYVRDRLSGLGEVAPTRLNPWAGSRDALAFPNFYKKQMAGTGSGLPKIGTVGAVKFQGQDQLQRDLRNLKASLTKAPAADAFMPSISVAMLEYWIQNQFYTRHEDFLVALADAMNEEYKAIVDAGFVVQIDDPRLVTYYMLEPNRSVDECRAWAEKQVELLNHALRGIPPERVRFHTCYSINMGPRVHDMAAKDIVDVIYKINAGAFSFEAANPRHEHEWKVWCEGKKRDDVKLIPGVVTPFTVLVEHPELVAERLMKYVDAVGAGNVIAGTDCGFATFAGSDEIEEQIAWAKLESLVQGAEIASRVTKTLGARLKRVG